jgi:hypothetical protein
MQERALLERLQQKANHVEAIYEDAGRDWEETAYRTLAQAWGMPNNATVFGQIAAEVPMRHLRRLIEAPLSIEALILGQAGLLNVPEQVSGDPLVEALEKRARKQTQTADIADPYVDSLRKEFVFQAGRLHLPTPLKAGLLAMGRTRPAYQPALRLAQLAAFIKKAPPLFDTFRDIQGVDGLVSLFKVSASPYWDKRYTLGPESSTGAPCVSYTTALGLIVNAVVPLLAAYGRQRNQAAFVHQALTLLEELPAESNHLTKPFTQAGLPNQDAAQSQGLLGLQKLFCIPGRCLQCQIGAFILKKEAVQPLLASVSI